jgi:hypothetical protein
LGFSYLLKNQNPGDNQDNSKYYKAYRKNDWRTQEGQKQRIICRAEDDKNESEVNN